MSLALFCKPLTNFLTHEEQSAITISELMMATNLSSVFVIFCKEEKDDEVVEVEEDVDDIELGAVSSCTSPFTGNFSDCKNSKTFNSFLQNSTSALTFSKVSTKPNPFLGFTYFASAGSL